MGDLQLRKIPISAKDGGLSVVMVVAVVVGQLVLVVFRLFKVDGNPGVSKKLKKTPSCG